MMSPGEIADEHRYQRDGATVSQMRKIARALGYAIAVHGSRGEKDLDVVAIPWSEGAVSAKELVSAFTAKNAEHVVTLLRSERISEACGEIKSNKPHGRMAVIFIREDDHRIIDLSVMPRRAAELFDVNARCANCDMHERGCILPKNNGQPTLPNCFIPRKEADMATDAPLTLEASAIKTAMKLRNAQSCATCGNARHNPGTGGPGDGFLECDANVLCRFEVKGTQICDHYNSAHGPKAMARG